MTIREDEAYIVIQYAGAGRLDVTDGIEKTEAGTPVLLEFMTCHETELSRPELD